MQVYTLVVHYFTLQAIKFQKRVTLQLEVQKDILTQLLRHSKSIGETNYHVKTFHPITTLDEYYTVEDTLRESQKHKDEYVSIIKSNIIAKKMLFKCLKVL